MLSNKFAILMLALSVSNTYCIQENIIGTEMQLQDSSTIESNQLSKIVQEADDVFQVDDTNNYGVMDSQNAKLAILSEQQLGNTINDLLLQFYNKIKGTNDSKIKAAEPFYKILYNPSKLSFTLYKEDINTFDHINNIINELKPLCKEHAIANVGKDTLYGLDKLEASLPTINEQFIDGYNFQIDFTKSYIYNEKKFTNHYRDMLYTVPATKNCVNFTNIEQLLKLLEMHSQNINNI